MSGNNLRLEDKKGKKDKKDKKDKLVCKLNE